MASARVGSSRARAFSVSTSSQVNWASSEATLSGARRRGRRGSVSDMRVAILDDYQQVSLASTDWSGVRSLGQIDVFAEHISRTEALVSALEPYDVVVAMRERTPFDADRLSQLPRLALLRHIPEEDQRLKLAGRPGGAALGFGGGWQRTVGTGLDGKRLGVVGLGK